METFFAIGVGAYGATTAAYLASLWWARPGVGAMAGWLLRASLAFWAGLLVFAAVQLGFDGGTRLWLGFSGWSLGVLYLVLLRRYPINALGSFVSALATALAVLALFVAKPSATLAGGVWATWLLRVHIGLAFIGVTAFGFATAVSIVYLMQSQALKQKKKSGLRRRLPPLQVLDALALRSIIVGFPFYTVALLLGSAQAIHAQGGVRLTYVLSFFSWFIYGAVLQARLTAGWRGRRAAIMTSVGLVTTLMVVALYSLGVA